MNEFDKRVLRWFVVAGSVAVFLIGGTWLNTQHEKEAEEACRSWQSKYAMDGLYSTGQMLQGLDLQSRPEGCPVP